jgi:hypothetical protein
MYIWLHVYCFANVPKHRFTQPKAPHIRALFSSGVHLFSENPFYTVGIDCSNAGIELRQSKRARPMRLPLTRQAFLVISGGSYGENIL